MIAEQYRNIKPHFVHAEHMPMVRRWSCILLDQDTENPPFEPARYFVANVFAETKEQVLDCLGEEYPWCDIMYIDKALGGHSDDDFLESWLHYFDANNTQPIREAPHGKENETKTFVVRERADVIFEYIVEARDEQEASDKVDEGSVVSHHTEWLDNDIIEIGETKYVDHQ